MRLLTALRRRPDPTLALAVWSAQLQLLQCAKREGAEAAGRLAAASCSQLDGAPVLRGLLRETIDLIAGAPPADDYEVLLDAWVEIQAGSLAGGERALVRCVRDAAIAYYRGAAPEQAMRAGWRSQGIDRRVPAQSAERPVGLGSHVPA